MTEPSPYIPQCSAGAPVRANTPVTASGRGIPFGMEGNA